MHRSQKTYHAGTTSRPPPWHWPATLAVPPHAQRTCLPLSADSCQSPSTSTGVWLSFIKRSGGVTKAFSLEWRYFRRVHRRRRGVWLASHVTVKSKEQNKKKRKTSIVLNRSNLFQKFLIAYKVQSLSMIYKFHRWGKLYTVQNLLLQVIDSQDRSNKRLINVPLSRTFGLQTPMWWNKHQRFLWSGPTQTLDFPL